MQRYKEHLRRAKALNKHFQGPKRRRYRKLFAFGKLHSLARLLARNGPARSGQWDSFSELPHCWGATGSGIASAHHHTAGSSGRWNFFMHAVRDMEMHSRKHDEAPFCSTLLTRSTVGQPGATREAWHSDEGVGGGGGCSVMECCGGFMGSLGFVRVASGLSALRCANMGKTHPTTSRKGWSSGRSPLKDHCRARGIAVNRHI